MTEEELQRVLKRVEEERKNSDREVASLKGQLEALIEILAGREVLSHGHRRHLAVVAARTRPSEQKVRLSQYVDKRTVPPLAEPLDCGALFHLCKGRCCGLQIELSTQDIEEGRLRWEVLEPYVLRRELDGRCTHQDRATFFCSVYEDRPATCRLYDCRTDKRIWLDFENKIPAPMLPLMTPMDDPPAT